MPAERRKEGSKERGRKGGPRGKGCESKSNRAAERCIRREEEGEEEKGCEHKSGNAAGRCVNGKRIISDQDASSPS